MGIFRRKKLSQRIFRVAATFESIAKQLRAQSRRMEREAERKFERVKELYRKGLTREAMAEARKVVQYRREAIRYDTMAENLRDLASRFMGFAPLTDIKKTLVDSVKVAKTLSGIVNLPTLGELFTELKGLMNELGVAMEAMSEKEGIADVTAEPVPELEVKEVLEKAAMEIGGELPTPELAGLEERVKKLEERGEEKGD